MILYEKIFFCKFLLHINDFLYAVNEAYKLHKNNLFYEKTITISKLQFPVKCIFLNENFICPQKWTFIITTGE